MSYSYKAKTLDELERIAGAVLAQYPARRVGFSVDIEGILEDLGLDLLPRQGIRKWAEGYLACDPRIIVIDESCFSYMPRARFTIAEEVCHLILEYRLWQGGKIPEGAKCHELSESQHHYIERDARSMAAALLMPREDFKVVFARKVRELRVSGVEFPAMMRLAHDYVAKEFEVSPQSAGFRLQNLGLLDKKTGEPKV